MSIRDILVHVDHLPHAAARLDVAFQLAQRLDAHLVGLFVESHGDVPDFIPGGSVRRRSDEKRRVGEKLGEAFDKRAKAEGVAAEWRQVNQEALGTNDVAELVSLNGRHADLVIVGQNDGETNDGSVPDDLPDRVVMGSGRPVLVIPYSGKFNLENLRCMVAWNAGREAARAVHDALPLLKLASKVVVLAVNPVSGRNNGHGEIPCADICAHLARHGVKAQAQHLHADDVGVGDILLSRAADEGVNLLVSGAYEKSRLRERVLGGVTRHLLGQMTVPVLMSR